MKPDPLITRTKIVVPRRRSELVSRPRLLALLDDLLDYKLLIVAAPAGYGKTSLLIDYASQRQIPVCWYALDPVDRDPLRFVSHVIASIQLRFPEFGRLSLAALQNSDAERLNLDAVATALANDLYENVTEHFALVVDDYHLVADSPDVERFINLFVQRVDENCHLVLVSRTLLTLPDLPLMVARSQVAGLSFEELAFQREEIRQLLEQNFNREISDQEAEQLYLQSEGWITGLLLSTQLSTENASARLRVARVSGVGLYEYLAQQVFSSQPADIQEALLRTSLLEEFDAALCAEVISPALNLPDMDWPGLIRRILHSNLFVQPVGESGLWLRYHHLFQAFLQQKMQAERPEESRRILTRLAEVYTAREEWERAFDLLAQLDQVEQTADLVEMAGAALLGAGRVRLLSGWLEDLPPAVVAERPVLQSLQGCVAVVRGDMERGRILLDQAALGLEREGGDRSALARTLLRRSTVHQQLGLYAEALVDVQRVMDLLTPDYAKSSLMAEALRLRALVHYYRGSLPEAGADLRASLDLYQEMGEMENVAHILMNLGMIERRLGSIRAAEEAYRQALDHWQKTGNPFWQANLYNNLGVMQHLRGEYLQAAASYEGALEQARQAGNTRIEAYVLAGLGDLYRDLDSASAARDAYQRAFQLAGQLQDQFLIFYLHLAHGVLARQQKRLKQARQHFSAAAEAAAESGSRYQEALIQLEQGGLLVAERHMEAAVQQLQTAETFFTETNQRLESAQALWLQALAHYANGSREPASEALARLAGQLAQLPLRQPLITAGREFQAAELIPEEMKADPAVLELVMEVQRFEQALPRLRKALRKGVVTVPLAGPHLVVRSLGRMEVRVQNRMVTTSDWKTQSVRNLFFFILNHPEGLTKDQVGEMFWPDASPAEVKLRFKNDLYRLRHAIGRNTIVFFDEIYRFNPDQDYEYDLETFLQELELSRQAADEDERARHLQAALKVYQGPFLPEIDETWVVAERERLAKLRMDAWLELAQLWFEQRRYDQVLDACQKMIREDDCCEEAYRLAMNVYDRLGNRAGVVRMYEHCVQCLMNEVGAPPTEQTRQLYERLVR